MLKALKALLTRLFSAPPELVSDVALEWAADRDLLPTSLRSGELRDTFSAAVRSRSVFSARTTHALYLQEVKDSVELAMQGGYENDIPMLRLRLKQALTRLGYTPQTGFPGDELLDIPEAKPGSLRDLSSDKRINLILETQIALARSASQKQRGLEPDRLSRWPGWELIRVHRRRVPRGEENTLGWAGRWLRAGGPVVPGGRLIARKDDPVWRALGDADLFDDAIGVDTPPFAYNSGLRWVEVSRSEMESLGLMEATTARPVAPAPVSEPFPDPTTSLRGMDPALRAALIERTKAKRAAKPDHIRFDEQLTRDVEAARAAYAAKPTWVESVISKA